MAFGDLLRELLPLGRFPLSMAQGWLAAWWTQLMAHLPIAVGLTLVGLDTVDPLLVDSARSCRSDLNVLVRVVLPLCGQTLLAGSGIIFLLVLLDFSVPTLFQVSSYPLAVFAEFSATNDPVRATAMALPFFLVGVPVLVGSLRVFRRASFRPRFHRDTWTSPAEWPHWFSTLQTFGLLFLGLHLVVPLVMLSILTGSIGNLGDSIHSASSEIAFSAGLCAFSALLSLPLGLAVAEHLERNPRRSVLWWVLVTIPLVIPAPLAGIGLISVWNRTGLGAVYSSDLMPLLAVMARFAPFAVLALFIERQRQSSGLLDAARVFQKSGARAFLQIRLPLLAPGLIAAAALVGSLSLGEVGATLLVLPPGRSTLALRIYDYLHYGASETVAGLALVLFLLALLGGGVASFVLGGRAMPIRRNRRGRP
jgi:iron(III) transport system permease protein